MVHTLFPKCAANLPLLCTPFVSQDVRAITARVIQYTRQNGVDMLGGHHIQEEAGGDDEEEAGHAKQVAPIEEDTHGDQPHQEEPHHGYQYQQQVPPYDYEEDRPGVMICWTVFDTWKGGWTV